MFNDLPEGAANHPEAPFNDRPAYASGRSRLAPGQADSVIAEAFARMEAAGMKPVIQTISGK